MRTKTRKQATPITYGLVQKRAKAMEKDTVRFLSDLVRTQCSSSREKNGIAIIKKEMQKIGFDGIRIDGLGSIIGRVPRRVGCKTEWQDLDGRIIFYEPDQATNG